MKLIIKGKFLKRKKIKPLQKGENTETTIILTFYRIYLDRPCTLLKLLARNNPQEKSDRRKKSASFKTNKNP